MTKPDWNDITITLAEIEPWAHNPRQISADSVKRFLSYWDRMGQFLPVVVGPKMPSGKYPLYDGHQRLNMLVDAKGLDLPIAARASSRPLNEDERAEMVAMIHVGATGQWDWDKLASWDTELLQDWGMDRDYLNQLNVDAGALSLMLESMGDGEIDGEGTDTEPQIDRAEELRQKWNVELGQLWKLGNHRIICGDCTDKVVVDRVMDGDLGEMMFTDPPYGVAIGDKNKFLNSVSRNNRIEKNLENDNISEEQLKIVLELSFDNVMSVFKKGGAWYVAAPPGPLHTMFGEVLKTCKVWRQTIQWVKNNATLSPMGVDYHWKAEPIFYGWVPGSAHRYYGGRKQTTVWEIDRPLASSYHPTMKPIPLVERAINNSSRVNEIVIDPFSGSGTTLIACENLGRQCRAIEIDPGYVAVTLQRWADHTGQTPELIDSI